jgi:ribonucleoside-diphosphate reductase subunit M2
MAREKAIAIVSNKIVRINDNDYVIPSLNVIKTSAPLNSKRFINLSDSQWIGDWVKNIGAPHLFRQIDELSQPPTQSITKTCYSVHTQDIGLPTFNLLVKSKRTVGKKKVYDLTVENPINSFLANGVVVHNCFYGFQIAMENVHGEVYSLLIDTLVDDQEEKSKLLRAVENYPSIKKLSDWAIKWMHSGAPFNQRLIAFACMEGILFSGPFCAIFWLKKRGLLPGLTFSNELISKDESLHMDFACLLNSMLKYPSTEETIIQIVEEAVEIEREFIVESLPCNLIGMNASEMTKYIEFVADRLLIKLCCKKYWNSPNPFTWMDLISTQPKTNFFERRVAEYNKAKFNQSKINPKLQPTKSFIEILDTF